MLIRGAAVWAAITPHSMYSSNSHSWTGWAFSRANSGWTCTKQNAFCVNVFYVCSEPVLACIQKIRKMSWLTCLVLSRLVMCNGGVRMGAKLRICYKEDAIPCAHPLARPAARLASSSSTSWVAGSQASSFWSHRAIIASESRTSHPDCSLLASHP